jgi:endonuclease I
MRTAEARDARVPCGIFAARRPEVIFTSFQGNRNPFIDHPEWAQDIWAA